MRCALSYSCVMQYMWQHVISRARQVHNRCHAAACPACHIVATQQAFATNTCMILLGLFMVPRVLPDMQGLFMQLLAHCCFANQCLDDTGMPFNDAKVCGVQGLQMQVLTSDQELGSQKGQTGQSVQQLKHVVGVQKLGLGMSSQITNDALLCTGQQVILRFHVQYCNPWFGLQSLRQCTSGARCVFVLDNLAFMCPAVCIDLMFGHLQLSILTAGVVTQASWHFIRARQCCWHLWLPRCCKQHLFVN